MRNELETDCYSKPGDAIECYSQAIALQNDYLNAYINLGTVYASQAQPQMAIQTFARAIGISPSSTEAFCNLERAWNAFEKAIHYNASYAEAYHGLGVICQETGDTAGAVLNFQKSARLSFEESQKVLRTRGRSW